MVTIICEMTSGGVMTAAKTRMSTIACLRYLIKKAGVNKPILTSRKVTIGNRKNNQV